MDAFMFAPSIAEALEKVVRRRLEERARRRAGALAGLAGRASGRLRRRRRDGGKLDREEPGDAIEMRIAKTRDQLRHAQRRPGRVRTAPGERREVGTRAAVAD